MTSERKAMARAEWIASGASIPNILIFGTAGNYLTILRRTLTFADPLPANWGFIAGDRVANIPPPSIRMRAAA